MKQEIRLWEKQGIGNTIQSLAYSPDGAQLASIDEGGVGTVRLWSNGALRIVESYETHAGNYTPFRHNVCSIAFSPDGTLLFWTRPRHPEIEVVAFSLSTRERTSRFVDPAGTYQALAFATSEGVLLLAAGTLWSVVPSPHLDLQAIGPLPANVVDAHSMRAFERQLDMHGIEDLVLVDQQKMFIRGIPSGKLLSTWVIRHEGLPAWHTMGFSSDGKILLCPMKHGVMVLDSVKGNVLSFLKIYEPAQAVFSSDQKWIIGASGDYRGYCSGVYIWYMPELSKSIP